MTTRIVISPGDVYEAIRELIPTLPPSDDVSELDMGLTPQGGRLVVTTFDRNRTVGNLARNEISHTVTVYEITAPAVTND